MFRLALTLVLFSLSIHSYSAPVNADCLAATKTTQNEIHHSMLCTTVDDKGEAKNKTSGTPGNEVLTQMRLSQRQPSAAESLMAMFFIPGLILLWIARFAKSNK